MKNIVNYKSGIGQVTKKGFREVEFERITVNKNVHEDLRKLNNHHGTYADDNGESSVIMFISQDKSKVLIKNQTTRDTNHLVAESIRPSKQENSCIKNDKIRKKR